MQQYELATMLLKVGHITSQISIFLKCIYPESWGQQENWGEEEAAEEMTDNSFLRDRKL